MELEFLRKVSLFANLNDEDLMHLNSRVETRHLTQGEYLFNEGDDGDEAFLIVKGQLEVIKSMGKRQVLLAVRDQGEVIGEISLFQDNTRTASIRARRDTELVVIDKEMLNEMISRSPEAAHSILNTIIARWNSTESLLKNSEKMAQLGTLSAGLAHELNNPASAIARSAGSLEQALDDFFDIEADIDKLDLQVNKQHLLQELRNKIKSAAKAPPEFNSLMRSDLEYEMEELLEEYDIEESYLYASTLVNLQFNENDVEKMADQYSEDEFPIIIKWLEKSYMVYSLQNEISEGAQRVSAIVKALKEYSYLDQAPLQEINIHDGINNTLLILQSKIKKDSIDVRKEYDDSIPKIQAYGSELNQVWTNLIDNAVDAMREMGDDHKKILTIRTRRKTDWIMVELEDNGPGIPDDIKDKIFNPFFTTKAPGKGTGLGLDISYNIVVEKHQGDIKVLSRPGSTCFQVYLPIDLDRIQGKSVMDEFIVPADEKLLGILDDSKTVAVIHFLHDKDSSAHDIPHYLAERDFDVHGIVTKIEPNIEETIPLYTDLDDIEHSIDLLLVFETGTHVTKMIDKAVRKNVKYLWMQEGVVNEEAALEAVSSGIDVVMDTCIRVTHNRLKE
ncbi:MAG: ATP-binding protein [Candidatus Kariarchaeaceae archaeon]